MRLFLKLKFLKIFVSIFLTLGFSRPFLAADELQCLNFADEVARRFNIRDEASIQQIAQALMIKKPEEVFELRQLLSKFDPLNPFYFKLFNPLPRQEIIDMVQVVLSGDLNRLLTRSLADFNSLSLAEKRAIYFLITGRGKDLGKIKDFRKQNGWMKRLGVAKLMDFFFENRFTILKSSDRTKTISLMDLLLDSELNDSNLFYTFFKAREHDELRVMFSRFKHEEAIISGLDSYLTALKMQRKEKEGKVFTASLWSLDYKIARIEEIQQALIENSPRLEVELENLKLSKPTRSQEFFMNTLMRRFWKNSKRIAGALLISATLLWTSHETGAMVLDPTFIPKLEAIIDPVKPAQPEEVVPIVKLERIRRAFFEAGEITEQEYKNTMQALMQEHPELFK